MARPSLEVADILNRHGDAFLARHRLSRGQLKVIGAIRACRTAALGGHVMACGDCDHATIAYNSCRNRHCPRCQGAAAKDWLADRQADLLPVPYFHVVYTLPAQVAAISARQALSNAVDPPTTASIDHAFHALAYAPTPSPLDRARIVAASAPIPRHIRPRPVPAG